MGCTNSLPSEFLLEEKQRKSFHYNQTIEEKYGYSSPVHSTDRNVLNSTITQKFPPIYTKKKVEKLIAGYIRFQIMYSYIHQQHKKRAKKVIGRLISAIDNSSSSSLSSLESPRPRIRNNISPILTSAFINIDIPSEVKHLIMSYFPLQNITIYCTVDGKYEALNKLSRLTYNEYNISYNYNTLLLLTIDCNVFYFNQFGRRNILNDNLIKNISMPVKISTNHNVSRNKSDFIRLVSYGIAARHAIFITNNNELYAIGNNTHGQFGGYSTLPVIKLATKWTWLQSYSLRNVFHSRTIVKIATGLLLYAYVYNYCLFVHSFLGKLHTLFLTREGNVYCTTDEYYYKNDSSLLRPRLIQYFVNHGIRIKHIECGEDTNLCLTNGKVYIFGKAYGLKIFENDPILLNNYLLEQTLILKNDRKYSTDYMYNEYYIESSCSVNDGKQHMFDENLSLFHSRKCYKNEEIEIFIDVIRTGIKNSLFIDHKNGLFFVMDDEYWNVKCYDCSLVLDKIFSNTGMKRTSNLMEVKENEDMYCAKDDYVIDGSVGYDHILLLTKYNRLYSMGDNSKQQCSFLNNVNYISEPYFMSKSEMGFDDDVNICRVIAGYQTSVVLVKEDLILKDIMQRFQNRLLPKNKNERVYTVE